MRVAVLVFIIGIVSAAPDIFNSRIVGGSLTTIDKYPEMAALLVTFDLLEFLQYCGGTILDQRSILTAAHCFNDLFASTRWRIRVGSSYANHGGTVHNVARIIIHPDYDMSTFDSDVAILKTATFITYSDVVQPGTVSGPNYDLLDNEEVWATGWGMTEYSSSSARLRDVQIWTINLNVCSVRYGGGITENMLCSGWLDVGGRDQCTGDSGGPLYHNGVVVGICSFGGSVCGSAVLPGVNTRVSRFTPWIEDVLGFPF